MICTKKNKIFLVGVFFVALGVGFAFVTVRNSSVNLPLPDDFMGKDFGMQIDDTKHTVTENGLRRWVLEASRVCVDRKSEKVMIDNPDIEFFSENGDSFYLSAKSGLIDTTSNYISVFGDVRGRSGDYIIETEMMNYNPDAFSLISGDSIVFLGKKSYVKADSIRIDLYNKLLRCEGNVESIFDDDSLF